MNKFPGYGPETENRMRLFHKLLAEDSKRRYAAVEAMKIGYGGVSYVARVLGCAQSTIHLGIVEIEQLESQDPSDWESPAGEGRVRRIGGGRSKRLDGDDGDELVESFVAVTKPHEAGSPTDDRVKWLGINILQISRLMSDSNVDASPYIVERILDESDYRRRSLQKELITGEVDPVRRNLQFENIARLKSEFLEKCLAVLSVDTKKKELIGPFYRRGGCLCTDPQIVYDHDYPHLAIGKGIPHGIYDVGENFGFVTIGTSSETSEFIMDSLARWQQFYGRHKYPDGNDILLLFDSGGANAVRSTRFKEDMISLSARLNKVFHIAHYPPYTSKWNPIEHRLFSQIERSLAGIALTSIQRVRDAVARTTTTTGLHVRAYISNKVYALARKCSAHYNELKDLYITPAEQEPMWNYTIDARLLG